MRVKVLRKRKSWVEMFLINTYKLQYDYFSKRLQMYQSKVEQFRKLNNGDTPIDVDILKEQFKKQ